MGSTTTQTTICNRALQLLGSQPISNILENSRGAKAMNRAYQPVLLQELRENYWSFALSRATLAASTTKPAFGKQYYYPLPGDFIALAPPDQVSNQAFGFSAVVPPMASMPTLPYTDFQIEQMPNNGGLAIASNIQGPLYIRYVTSDITESAFDPTFAEMLACSLAIACCEELTQSNTKLSNIENIYKEAHGRARQRNAFEEVPVQPPVDNWLLVRM